VISSSSAIAQEGSARSGVSYAVGEGHGSSLSQPDNDISELRDTFWRLNKLHGSTWNGSGVVIDVIVRVLTPDEAHGIVTFSTPAYFISFPLFVDKSAGLKFSPAYAHGGMAENGRFPKDQETGKIFGEYLQRTCCYELRGGTLTLMDRERNELIVLSALQQKGLENRRWRIAKYRGDDNDLKQNSELVDAKEPADVVFMNGRVEGSPGCGGWAGTYVISGDNLTSDVGINLAGLCSSGQQSYLVERALKGTRRVQQEGNGILLMNGSKAQLLLVPFSGANHE